MPHCGQILALIDRIRRITSEEERQGLLGFLGQVERPTVLSFVNAHAINLCWSSAPTLAAFRASDIMLRDGIGIRVAMSALARPSGLNMNGTDFIPALLANVSPRRLAVYGTSSPWLERGCDRIAAMTPHAVIDTQTGFHPTEHYVVRAKRERPDIILLAMGMPRQEEVAAALKRALDHPVLIINGGAIVDFLAGRVPRAPAMVRRCGLEWAFRLAREPRRLFRRYGVGGILFARNVVLLRRAAGERPSGAPVYKEL